MPRLVDHDARRRELAGALWRVARTQGIDRVSVRTVATEAGTSPGALRHYFATQEELATFALRLMVETVGERIREHLARGSGRQAALAILEELLPIGEVRRAEVEVYLAFVGLRSGDESLRAVQAEVDAESRRAVAAAAALLGMEGDDEVEDLYAFVDGLALHGILWPDRYPPERLRELLVRRLEGGR